MAGVLELYRYLNPDDPMPEPSEAATQWSKLLASEVTQVFVADIGGLLVSTCVLVIVPNLARGGRPFEVIENVVTHPNHQKKGIGSSILGAAFDAAWNAGCYKVMLATGSKNEATLRFYEGAGSSEAPRHSMRSDEYERMPFGASHKVQSRPSGRS
jgi:GNAT superfamily N-acetyltransferase